MFLLGSALYVTVFVINAVAVLNEERFLARIGWSSAPQATNANMGFNQSYDQGAYGTVQQDVGVKTRLIQLITAIRTLMRIPLIVINIAIIVYELLFG